MSPLFATESLGQISGVRSDVSYKLYDNANPPNVIGTLPCSFATTLGGFNDGDSGQGIVQFGPTDSVLITYPNVDPATGLQRKVAVAVSFGADGNTPTVLDSNLIDETANNRHVLQANLTGVDHFEYGFATSDLYGDGAVLYWLSASPDFMPTQVTAKYAAVHNGLVWTAAAQLSLNVGTPDSWSFLASGGFFGDYSKGAFFFSDFANNATAPKGLNFFLPWPQTVPSLAANVQMHANIVTLPR